MYINKYTVQNYMIRVTPFHDIIKRTVAAFEKLPDNEKVRESFFRFLLKEYCHDCNKETCPFYKQYNCIGKEPDNDNRPMG